MQKWWHAIPGRLEAELEALRSANLRHVCNQPDLDGFVQITVTVEVEGVDTELHARFPDTYPYFRPEVKAPALALKHHQNPFQKNLCLLGRQLNLWTPQMSLAELLVEQLPKVVAANRESDPAQLETLEEHQAEPISVFYSYEAGVCLLDPADLAGLGGTGSARFAIQDDQLLRCAALDVTDQNGLRHSTFHWHPAKYPAKRVAPGRWVVLDEPIVEADPVAFDAKLCQLHPSLAKNVWDGSLDLILVGFPQETGWRSLGRGWVLLVRKKVTSKGIFRAPLRSLVRVDRVDRQSYDARSQEAALIASGRVASFGVGCVGAPIALELARAGIKDLLLIDGDEAEFAASVRWPLGLTAAGVPKVVALAWFIAANFPYTNVTFRAHRLGTVHEDAMIRDESLLDHVLANSDVIVDATAEFAVQQMLSDFALAHDKPFISAHATHGGYGGEILSLERGRTGCWICLAHHRQDQAIPLPLTKTGDWTQPPGCAAPTFQGASWDVSEVSLGAVRTITARLSGTTEPWDLSILSLRDQLDNRIAPTWSTHRVSPHDSCSQCAAR